MAMNSSSAAKQGLRELIPGAQVEHQGESMGSVEEVVMNPSTGEPEAILVRHGRADYLLRVPAEYVRAESPSSVEISADVELDAMERAAVTSGRTPPTGEHITDGGPTEPSDKAEGLVGENAGMPASYDGPATG
jgi:sporulation protein YlmC with PRC-barrel domain